MKTKLPSPIKILKNNESGMAILLVLSFIMMITFIAQELAFESRAEYEFSNINYRELKAYHAAKSGAEISLFRILLFQQTKAQFGDKIPDASMLDMIWSFPMAWPPNLPEDASLIAKDDLEDVKKDSLQDAEWIATIQPEGSKIDLNDLDSPSEALQKAVSKQISQLIRNRLDQDDEWARDQGNLDPDEIVKHMIDYIDKDEESKVGGAESSYYKDNSLDQILPPNRMFRTMDELLQIPGMDVTLYEHLHPSFTLYGIRAINVNHASEEVLMSLDPQITKELATEIKSQIQNPEEGPFKNEDEFKNFIARDVDLGSFNQDKIPLVFAEESAFTIDATGSFKKAVRGIKLTVLNVENVTESLTKTLKAEAQENNNSDSTKNDGSANQGDSGEAKDTGDTKSGDSSTNTDSTTNSTPKQKRPNVVQWEEY